MTARGYELDEAVRALKDVVRLHDLKAARVRLLAAANTTYDPTASGLTATDLQAAVDELEAMIDALAAVTAYATIPFFIDGGGAVPTTGLKIWVGPIDFAGEIEAGTLLGDQTGSAEVDVQTTTEAAWDPPTVPASSESITGGTHLAFTGAKKSQNTTLSGWTTAFTVGTIFAFELVSVATITKLEGALKVRRT